jgi:uncharacterized membrane protein YtjA (UPF0391 family)
VPRAQFVAGCFVHPRSQRFSGMPIASTQAMRALRSSHGATPRSVTNPRKGADMLHYALVFLVIALIAALFGFGGIAAGAVEIAQVLFFIFLVLFVVSLIAGLLRRRT